MSDELKPCPFCGNDVNDDEGCFQAGGFRAPATPYFVVRCGNPFCNAETSAESPASAIAAWNRRAPTPDLEKERQALIRHLEALLAEAKWLEKAAPEEIVAEMEARRKSRE